MCGDGWRGRGDGDMTRTELLQRISIDPQICGGKPCVRGHRIWVSLILDLLADGVSERDILANYPGLTAEDLRACIEFGGIEPVSNKSIPDHHGEEFDRRIADAEQNSAAGMRLKELRAGASGVG